MADEFVSEIKLYVDSQEIDVLDLASTTKTGRKMVKTMKRNGVGKGRPEYNLQITVAIPVDADEPDWDAMTGAKITIFPEGGGKKTSYLGCFSVEVGEKYSLDNEARRDIQVQALDKKVE